MRFGDSHGHYELNPFPGCSAIVVSNHAFIRPDCRGQGLGQCQHRDRIEKAIELGYNMMICTVRADNRVEKHILDKNGWCFFTSFLNKETGHNIEIWGKHL